MPGTSTKLVVLGSGGRVGQVLARAYAQEACVVGLTRADLDLTSGEAIERVLGNLDFDVLINCAGATSPDYCETHGTEAFAVNAHAVGKLGEICSRKRARCLHFSTDYVFDGLKDEPYTEQDEAVPINLYGVSKLRGEEALLRVSDAHLVVRVSWVFGPGKPGFVDQILKRAMETDRLEGIADKWSMPTCSLDIAAELRPFLREMPVGGVLHLTQTGEPCSWQEYGQQVLDCAAEAGIPLRGRTVAPQRMADVEAFVAKRPVRTAMATRRLAALTGRSPRPWREALADYVERYYGRSSG